MTFLKGTLKDSQLSSRISLSSTRYSMSVDSLVSCEKTAFSKTIYTVFRVKRIWNVLKIAKILINLNPVMICIERKCYRNANIALKYLLANPKL